MQGIHLGACIDLVVDLLVARNPEISPYAILLIFFHNHGHAICDIRRVVKREPIGAPDRLHFHQLMMRGLGLTYFDRTQRNVTNPLATALVLPMTAVQSSRRTFMA